MLGVAAGDLAAGQPIGSPLARAAQSGVRAGAARLATFAALFALALIPALTTPIPAMVDYLNHLARMYELAASGTADASLYYHVVWKFYPNLAMDLLVPQLAHWTGVELATRIFLIVSQILVVTGSVAIELSVKRRFAVSGFVAVLYLFNIPFAWGFLNFEFALGVALWGIACWLAMREQPWPRRFVVHALFVSVLFAAHLFALGLYGATLGIHELWAAKRSPRPVRQAIVAMLLLAPPAVALAIVMKVTGGSVGGAGNLWEGLSKGLWPFLLLNGDNAILSCLGTVLLGCLVHAMAKQRELRFEASGLWLAVGLCLLYIVVPGRLFDTAFVDIRVLVGALMIVPAFITVTFTSPRRAHVAAALMIGVTLANLICIETVWRSYQPVYDEVIKSFRNIEPGARIIVGTSGEENDPPINNLADYPLYHAPTLAVHYAKAFVPTLFTTTGKQPITAAADVERLTFSCGDPAPLAVLRATSGKVASTTVNGNEVPDFLKAWRRDFDYVYLLGTPIPDPIPGVLDLVETHPSFALYKIRKPAGA